MSTIYSDGGKTKSVINMREEKSAPAAASKMVTDHLPHCPKYGLMKVGVAGALQLYNNYIHISSIIIFSAK